MKAIPVRPVLLLIQHVRSKSLGKGPTHTSPNELRRWRTGCTTSKR